MYRYICPDCGAHLDPGEKCDCAEENAKIDLAKLRASQEAQKMIVIEKGGQYKLAV